MRHITLLLFLVLIFTTSCDEESFSWESNPPEVRLVVLNQDELAEKSVGDSINLELGLELYNMQDLYFIDFKVYFDTTIFTPDSFNYEIFPSFFSTTGDPFSDLNGNGQLDEDSEEYIDINANGQYDPPVQFPIGGVTIEPTYFHGGLGIGAPANNGGNAWGTGRLCEFYLSGILTESIFSIDIVNALEYQEGGEPLEHPVSVWDVFTLIVGSPYNPVLSMEQESSSEGYVTVSFQIDDSPNLAELNSLITYDSNILSYTQHEFLEFFNEENYSLSLNHYVNDIEDQGEFALSFQHNVIDDSDLDVTSESFSNGTGGILDITFLVISAEDSTSTIQLSKNNIGAMGYDIEDSQPYSFDINYWDVEESLQVNF